MAPQVRASQALPKRPLTLGLFYPSEVVRILGLEGMDYRQLRQLFQIVRKQAGQEAPLEGKWARFAFRDLVAVKAALYLAGGEEALAPGRRLRLQDVEKICAKLKDELGLSNPLTEIAFKRRGRTVIARVQGLLFEPGSGQMLIAEVEQAVERYLDESPSRGGQKNKQRALLAQEVQKLQETDADIRRSEARLEVSFG